MYVSVHALMGGFFPTGSFPTGHFPTGTFPTGHFPTPVLRNRSRPEPPFLAGAETITLFRLRLQKVSYKSIFIDSFFFVNNDIFLTTKFFLNKGIFITTNSFLNIVKKCFFFKVIGLAAQGYVLSG